MYRQRRRRLQRRRRVTVVAVSVAALALVASVPTLAFGDPVGVLLNNISTSGSGGGGTSGGSTGGGTDRAGVPETYVPPLHGTNPHGEGSNIIADISPSDTNPYPATGDPGEEIVLTDSRGDQAGDGSYHGTATLLWLLGNPIIQIQTDPGEQKDGPLQPLQDGLDNACQSSNGAFCLTVLGMHSSSTSNSSTNSQEILGVHLGGENGLNADVGTSNGNISDDGNCQTAHGDSGVANVTAGGTDILHALNGSSTSTACNGGSSSVENSSQVLNLFGSDVPFPADGCDSGDPNVNFTPLSPLLAAVCGADDTNGSQGSSPYGVREALTLFALITGDSALLKAGTATPESLAVAPGGGNNNPPPGGNPGGNGGGTQGAGGKGGGNGNGGGNAGGNAGGGAGAGAGGGAGAGAGAAAANAAGGNGNLAFTGADLLVLGLVGSALILGGLALTTAGRRHRQTV